MNFIDYLKDRRKTIGFLIFATISIQILLLVYPMHLVIRLYIFLMIPVCYFIGTVWEYARAKSFYENVQKNLEQLEEKFLVVETIPTARFSDAKILKEVLQETNKSMLEHVNRYKQSQEEYKEYIELWIHEIKLPQIGRAHV